MALAAGLWLGGHPTLIPSPLRKPFVDKQTRVVAEAMDEINDTYYRKIPRSALADASIKGMVQHLGDRFSNYFTPKEYRGFKQSQNSEFSGVGMTVSQDPQGLRVAQVYAGSPAKRAGIRAGDLITKVGTKSLKGLSSDAASALVKGPPGTRVLLTFKHASGKTVVRLVTRATVNVPMVASAMKTLHGQKIGVVALAQFGSGAHGEVDDALSKLERRGATRFVFDLRHNGGGLVTEAQLISSAFLQPGAVVVTTRGRSVPSRTLHAVGKPVAPTQPLVVLVDDFTASASEIVTGALKDDHRATVVGTRTFGKGVFQEVIELSNGGALDITAGQYFTPDGHNLGGQGVKTGAGITPDVIVKDNVRTPRRDEALDRALRVVAGLPSK